MYEKLISSFFKCSQRSSLYLKAGWILSVCPDFIYIQTKHQHILKGKLNVHHEQKDNIRKPEMILILAATAGSGF